MDWTLATLLFIVFFGGLGVIWWALCWDSPDKGLEDGQILSLRIDHEQGHHSNGYRPLDCPMCWEEDECD